MFNLVAIAVTATLLFTQNASGASLRRMTDKAVIEYAYGKAKRLSGINSFPIEEMPPIFFIKAEDIGAVVCPENPSSCQKLVGIFQDIEYRVLLRSDFDLDKNLDLSFLIHELVHALQYRERGPDIFKNCAAIYRSEEAAYGAQDQFLKEEGEFYRASVQRRFFHCDEDEAAREYQKSLAIWKQRGHGWHPVSP